MSTESSSTPVEESKLGLMEVDSENGSSSLIHEDKKSVLQDCIIKDETTGTNAEAGLLQIHRKMSFICRKDYIEEGDTVILFLNMSAIYPIEVVKQIPNRHGQLVENKFQSIYGALKVMELVGKKYGSKVNLTKGWAYVLHPTCELWTKSLPHRTQIIYSPDISLIIFGLDLSPGSIVIEAGTGSGSLSHALIRSIYPTGHLFTFDFHEKRAETAREEFEKHGLSQWVTVGHRDVISEGFNVEKLADAIFLDLPCPWEVVPHVQRSLKRGGKLCTFSPCIEQVQRTCEALKKSNNFIMIQTQECLQRQLSVQTRTITHLEFEQEALPPPNSSSSDGNKKFGPVKKVAQKFRTVVPPDEMPGHTGYTTFATFIPQASKASSSEGNNSHEGEVKLDVNV